MSDHSQEDLPAVSAEVARFQVFTMRTVASTLGGPGSCTRRACQRTGLCHMNVGSEGAADCGAEFPPGVLDCNCEAILFFIAHYARVFRCGEPWSRYDGELGGASERK